MRQKRLRLIASGVNSRQHQPVIVARQSRGFAHRHRRLRRLHRSRRVSKRRFALARVCVQKNPLQTVSGALAYGISSPECDGSKRRMSGTSALSL